MNSKCGSIAFILAGLLVFSAWPPAHAQGAKSASVSVAIRISPFASIDFPDGFDFIIEVPDENKGKGHDNGKGKGHDSHGNGNGYGHDKDGYWPIIRPVLIPFKVHGNALASVSVAPDEFMRIDGGLYLGLALKDGGGDHKNQKGNGHPKGKGKGHDDHDDGRIGYNVIVQFPINSWLHASIGGWDGLGSGFWDDFAGLPGQDGVGTPALSADVSLRRHGVLGMIYIVAKHRWTEDGRDAAPGKYRGTVEVTLTAGEQ
jgi:hypothetical protein